MSQPQTESQPLPVQPLQYVIPAYRGRPGLITAIGVISIVLASLGILGGLFSVLQASGYYMMSIMSTRVTARATSRSVVVTAPAPVPVNGGTVPGAGPRGMNDVERRAAAAALTRLRPMTPRRKSQLDAILAQAGKDMAVDDVTASGVMDETRSGEAPPDYFVTPAGRLEVFNDRAVFFPSNNSPAVRVSAPPTGAANPPAPVAEGQTSAVAVEVPATAPAAATTAPAIAGLTPAEVQSVVQQAQASASPPLNAAQVAALQALLAAPGQQLVQPGAVQGAVLAVYNSGGSSVVQFSNGGSVTIASTGAVTSMSATPVMPTFSINPVSLTAMAVTAVLSLALAVYLLVCGILTLRQSQRARRQHLIYVALKLPVAVAGAVAAALVNHDIKASVTPAGGAAPTWTFSLFTGGVPLVLGCAYPLALLIALNLKQVKDYYAAGAGQALTPA
jgi:hypothetical protein